MQINHRRNTENIQNNDVPLLNFKSKETVGEIAFSPNETSEQYKSDGVQLNKDAVWLAELYQGIQNGEEWAIKEAKNLQVAEAPADNDNSSNAQLLRSNNELASAIKNMVTLKSDE